MTSGRSQSPLWRDPKRGKHHMDDGTDAGLTRCGLVIFGFWENEGATRWADEDFCKKCARLEAM